MTDRTKHSLILTVAALTAFAFVFVMVWIDQKYFAPHYKEEIKLQERLKHHKK